jgi:hypothetical protein
LNAFRKQAEPAELDIGQLDGRDVVYSEDRLPDGRRSCLELSALIGRERFARPGVAAYLDAVNV